MTDLDNQILALKNEVANNRRNAERFGVPIHLDIAGLEDFLKYAVGGNRRAEANQLLNNLKKLRDLEKQNIHELKTYQFTSEQFGEFQIKAISVEEAQIKFNEWEREQELEEEPYVYSSCIDVYRLSNGRVMATRETVGYETEADYLNVQHLLVRGCGSAVPSDQEVRDYYGYTEPEPEIIKETWWVIRPSGLIEQLTVTQKFKDTMTAQGWIFSKEKPTIEEPQNQNISIVFYIGKGSDLKTHFGINSIVVTPDEAEQLSKWLFQNYNTKIRFVMNRLTDDIRTHTQQQLKDLIIQKLKDDKPESDDITEEDIKKPQQAGLLGAGVGGAIGILILIGMLADSRRKR